ncbi:hypothetical protein DL96DRAFT_1625514 [Flagelloscypha sp. PMI_526]|nr:hypothetical protein DL96DRAFT_1625514 [Flagelloscypha sp. PMI_526]
MALPPPNHFRTNFYQPINLYADPHDDDKHLVLYRPPSKSGVFSSFLKRFCPTGQENMLKAKWIDVPKSEKVEFSAITVSLESLEWLENTCRKATSRSAMWAKEDLVDIQTISGDHKTHTRGYSVAGAKDVDLRHSRAAAAARTVLSLPEVPLPILPQELVRCIFLWIARQDVTEAKTLSLVSTAVQNLVDPCVFKYFNRVSRVEEMQSSRLLRAKEHFITGYNLLAWPLEITSVCRQLPALRSISCSIGEIAHVAELPPSIRRLHIDYYSTHDLSLSSNVFSGIIYLSLNLKLDHTCFYGWEPLKDLVGLRCFIFRTHSFPHELLSPNDVHAKLWIEFVVLTLLPYMPTSVELVLWVIPDIKSRKSLEHFRILFDGSADRRLLVAFQKGNGSDTHATSESAGAGSYAFVYPALKEQRHTGLDWLEWLWEEGLTFLNSRERASKVDTV